ncbi:MAG: TolC family protein, partial [Fibrobacterota bacterium]
MRIVLTALLAASIASGAEVLKLSDIVARTLRYQPQLAEHAMDLERAQSQVDLLKRKVILPRFDVTVGFGPAPGFRYQLDSSNVTHDSTTGLYSGKVDSTRKYAWWPMGPTFASEIEIAQPLNVGKLRAGMRAARAGVRVAAAELDANRTSSVKEVLGYLFGFQYATRMRNMLEEANTRLDSVETALQEKLDNDEDDVSQADVFQLRIGRYELEKSLQEAKLGQNRAREGLAFSLGYETPDSLQLADSLLQPLPELPAFDTLANHLAHP